MTEVAGDITTPAGREAALKACPDPDILINNAGGPPPGDFRNWTRDDWIKAIDANMLTPIELIKATVDGMMARKFGRIVNITSAAVKAPIEVLGLSNGARAGLTGFVAGIARKTVINNVTINGLLPGPFDTDRLRGAVAKAEAEKRGVTVDQMLAERGQAQSRRALRRARGIRPGLRVPLRRQGRLHHRPEHPARRRRLPGHAVKSTSRYERRGVCLTPRPLLSHRRGALVGPRQSEFVEAFSQKIAEQRFAEQIARGPPIAPFRGFTAQIVPFLDRAVAAAEPHQRDQIDLFLFGQGIDELGDFSHDRIVAVILQHIDHIVVGPIGPGIQVGRHILDIEFSRFLDQKSDFFG